MARVTIEDCLEIEKNKYILSTLAFYRAHELLAGKEAMVEDENDKKTVIALREIAERHVDTSVLEDMRYRTKMMEYRQKAMQQDQAVTSLGAVDNL